MKRQGQQGAQSVVTRMQNATESHMGSYSTIDSTGASFPKPSVFPYYSATQSGMCNVYIPNDGTLSR